MLLRLPKAGNAVRWIFSEASEFLTWHRDSILESLQLREQFETCDVEMTDSGYLEEGQICKWLEDEDQCKFHLGKSFLLDHAMKNIRISVLDMSHLPFNVCI